MSCTLLSRRSCSVVESDCSKALTCGLWDTNALNLQRRRRPRMLFCGTKGPLTPNNRLQRSVRAHEPRVRAMTRTYFAARALALAAAFPPAVHGLDLQAKIDPLARPLLE